MKIYIGVEKEGKGTYSSLLVTTDVGKVIYSGKKKLEGVSNKYESEIRALLWGVKKVGVKILNQELEVKGQVKMFIRSKTVLGWLSEVDSVPKQYVEGVGELLYELSFYPKEVEVIQQEQIGKKLKQALKLEGKKKIGVSVREMWG